MRLARPIRISSPALLLLLACAGAPLTAADRPPNLLLVMTDDQGYGDLSLHGNPNLATPNLDRLAGQSIRFDRFFVSPVCAPTRAALLTGRYPLRTGVWGVTHGKETMRAEELTLAEALHDAGYQTGIFGKWHNGEHYPHTPQGQGFDTFLGFHNGHWNNYVNTRLESNGVMVATQGYISDVLTDAAMAFMREHRDVPFFCYVPYNAPHSPFQVPDRYFERFKALGLSVELACIYGMCANLDDNVGKLLEQLDAVQLANDTIVVFLTDNGPNSDRYNVMMRGRKGSVHEGGVRVPCFIRWPRRFPEGRTVTQIAAHIDLFPTLLDLCGLPAPNGPARDGRSLRPLMEGNAKDWKDRLLFRHRFRRGQDVTPTPGAVRSQRYLAVNEGRGWQLFDMVADPGQSSDVAEAHADLMDRFKAAYDEWFASVTAIPLTQFPIPVGYAEENPVLLPAPQAHLQGTPRFKGGAGWANDWITGWNDTEGSVAWELDVVRGGRYRVALDYLCPEGKAGAVVGLNVGNQALTAVIVATPIRQVPSPDREPRKEVYEMEWVRLPMGEVELPAGTATLRLQAAEVPHAWVMDLKHVVLERVEVRD